MRVVDGLVIVAGTDRTGRIKPLDVQPIVLGLRSIILVQGSGFGRSHGRATLSRELPIDYMMLDMSVLKSGVERPFAAFTLQTNNRFMPLTTDTRWTRNHVASFSIKRFTHGNG